MSLTDPQRACIAAFRDSIESALTDDRRFSAVTRHDRPDGSTLATRWQAAEHVWFELALRPFIPQVRIGILTDDRWKSEDFEDKIEESGDSMSEFVGLGMNEAGLNWDEPPVEHYRADLTHFYFATPLELQSLDDLSQPAVRDRALKMLDGYFRAFENHLG